ncbi:pentapeptide repeat-containing protein, partial [Citrobacter sp. wls619]|uniref:pentapeptide repeat-containing protein n=1 Tax=Citrobacter sp. wls619 TaxID=2576432 RepID=UPI0010C95F3D
MATGKQSNKEIMKRVEKAANYINASLHLNRNDDANVAKHHGVKDHLKNFFIFGKKHAEEKRVAGLMAVSTGLAAALAEMQMTPDKIKTELDTGNQIVTIDFTVGESGKKLAGSYRLNLTRYDGGIRFSLSDTDDVNKNASEFNCSEEQLNKGLGTLITVNLLQYVDQHLGFVDRDRLTQFLNTGRINLVNVNFTYVILADVFFAGADLSGANLKDAGLHCADL